MSILNARVPCSCGTLAVSAGACILGGVMGGLIVKKLISSYPVTVPETDPLPEKWLKVGEIMELLIYPVKSLQGISVNEAKLANLGLQGADDNELLRDRVFAVVDEQGAAVSQKKLPILALIGVKIDGNSLTLYHSKDSSIQGVTIEVPKKEASLLRVGKVMGEDIEGVIDCGDVIANWLCKVCDASGLRLFYHVEKETKRGSVKRNSRFHTYRENHTAAFQDETSYMLMTDESIIALNENIEGAPVSHKNFRPTLYVSGASEPFAEDFWGFVRFGSKDNGPIIKTSLPCQRCKLTTVDPETGTFRDDEEPLRSLYRLKRPIGDEKVGKLVSRAAVIGTHFGLFEGEGSVIRVGDPVYVAVL